MTIESVEEWLGNNLRTYLRGVELFEHYSSNSFLKRMFNKGEDQYNFNRLMRELQSIVDANKQPVVTPDPLLVGKVESDAAPAEDVPAIPEEYTRYKDVSRKVDVSTYPEELQKMIAEKGELYRQTTYMHSQLMHIATDKERAKAADTIVLKYRRIMEIWAEVDYFEEFKIMKPKSRMDISQFTVIQLIKRRNTLRTYVSRYKHF